MYHPNSNQVKEDQGLTFGALVDLEKLESVSMTNNSGTFELTHEQIKRIREELSSMTFQPEFSAKVGAISMELRLDGKTHRIYTSTHGDYVEVHRDLLKKGNGLIDSSDWLYFRTERVNFDNYKEEKP